MVSNESVSLHAEAALALAKDQAYVHYLAYATLLQGVCWAHMGRAQESIEGITQAIASITKMGAILQKSLFLSWLAEAYLIAGQAQDGLEALDEAFAHMNKTDERFAEAALHRIKGELLLVQGRCDGEAEECFNQALDVARGQSAKSLELRAAVSLSRLWQKQGKIAEARRLLSGIYGWFTEGFGTPDLIDAKALIEELA